MLDSFLTFVYLKEKDVYILVSVHIFSHYLQQFLVLSTKPRKSPLGGNKSSTPKIFECLAGWVGGGDGEGLKGKSSSVFVNGGLYKKKHQYTSLKDNYIL